MQGFPVLVKFKKITSTGPCMSGIQQNETVSKTSEATFLDYFLKKKVQAWNKKACWQKYKPLTKRAYLFCKN